MARPLKGRDPKKASSRLTRAQKIAAVLLANGKSVKSVSENPDVRVSIGTIRKWRDEDPLFADIMHAEQEAVLTEYRHKLTPYLVDSTVKALKTLRGQAGPIDPYTREPNDPWIRLNASRALATMGMGMLDQAESKDVEVIFRNMPEIGSPGADKVEPADGSDVINAAIAKAERSK